MKPGAITGLRLKRVAGFSLIELMLALTLGVVMTAGIVQLFVGNQRTFTVLNGQSRLQENGRFSLEFISRAARTAGYFGCAPEINKVANNLNGTWNQIFEFDVTTPVEGFEGSDGTFSPALTTLPRTIGGVSANVYIAGNGIDTTTILPGTDVLVLRHVRVPGVNLAETLQPTGDPVVVATGGVSPFAQNDIVLVSDCEQGALFRVTGVAVAADEATLSHAVGGGGTFENTDPITYGPGADIIPATLSGIARSYGPETTVADVITTIFFIAPSAGTNNFGQTPNSLWQKVGTTAPVELLQGVEDLEIRYGVDTTLTDGVNNANQYMDFEDVPDPAQIMSLTVMVTVNSGDVVVQDVGDGLIRRTFTETIVLRNARPEG